MSSDEIDKQGKHSSGIDVGDMSVVMGKIPAGSRIGYGSVVLGPTDDRGNCIYTQPMTVGYAAKGDPGSIVIGAFAGGGSSIDPKLEQSLSELLQILKHHNLGGIENSINDLKTAVVRKDPGLVARCYEYITIGTNMVSAAEAVPKIKNALFAIKGFLVSAGLMPAI